MQKLKTGNAPEIGANEYLNSTGYDEERVREFLLLGIPLMDPAPVVPFYARLCAGLQDKTEYQQIGQNDLWIASVSLAFGTPLVTRNRRHFGAVEGLAFLAIAEIG